MRRLALGAGGSGSPPALDLPVPVSERAERLSGQAAREPAGARGAPRGPLQGQPEVDSPEHSCSTHVGTPSRSWQVPSHAAASRSQSGSAMHGPNRTLPPMSSQ
ncbi:hypothetical protein SAMN02745121_03951 [Nannocystis exedens]|uniref:Uncharacterized protein n=1 Tax=Nannocystis exedens TaxID=54 RepID=A0A1I1ZTH4_9BACT|nr:hypothetical protein SAMN02745121_03951 [Nannocystis exedens]